MRDRGQGAGVGLLVGLALLTSGCVTTLGYVPEAVKPEEDKETLRASYKEVRKWASDVADGYDSRNTMNRHAIYAGATLAAASVSAIAGLAAFGSNSSALIGIPIGTGFLGALAAIYQSDEKAAIYREGAQYVKDLIVLSEERLQKFDEDDDGALRVAASEKAETAARRRVADTDMPSRRNWRTRRRTRRRQRSPIRYPLMRNGRCSRRRPSRSRTWSSRPSGPLQFPRLP